MSISTGGADGSTQMLDLWAANNLTNAGLSAGVRTSGLLPPDPNAKTTGGVDFTSCCLFICVAHEMEADRDARASENVERHEKTIESLQGCG
jgi:hypothetical protein